MNRRSSTAKHRSEHSQLSSIGENTHTHIQRKKRCAGETIDFMHHLKSKKCSTTTLFFRFRYRPLSLSLSLPRMNDTLVYITLSVASAATASRKNTNSHL